MISALKLTTTLINPLRNSLISSSRLGGSIYMRGYLSSNCRNFFPKVRFLAIILHSLPYKKTYFQNNLLTRTNNLQLITPKRFTQTKDTVEKGKKYVGAWLLGCSGMVFVAVVLGAYFVIYYSTTEVVSTALEEATRSGKN